MAVKCGSRAGHTHRKIQRKCGKRTKKNCKKRTPLSTGSLNQKFEPKTLGIATLWTGVRADIAIKHFAATRSLQPAAAQDRHSYISRYWTITNNRVFNDFYQNPYRLRGLLRGMSVLRTFRAFAEHTCYRGAGMNIFKICYFVTFYIENEKENWRIYHWFCFHTF